MLFLLRCAFNSQLADFLLRFGCVFLLSPAGEFMSAPMPRRRSDVYNGEFCIFDFV